MQRKRDKIAEADVHMHISHFLSNPRRRSRQMLTLPSAQDVVLVDGLVSPIQSEPFTYYNSDMETHCYAIILFEGCRFK